MKPAALLVLTLCLAACEEQAAAPAAQGGAASGEVLEGSISDAMIPLDQLESQAPLAPRQAVPVGDVDSQQPEVTPVPGINDVPQSQGAEAAPAAPAPEPAE
ncbi:hypothetical protein C0V72_08720 [Porphyrobacter sp. TH134]|uniref:hypothetical protein n=1 Tax=Porphyrobacter sp. TH134 TaxID=2067450 RepID=UPI000C7E1E5B|nr:hypothetical protein [Porphyrobacter sp. TH134]PLK23592.1 hypothetical protein C0V72_08720 [Porphyrobacter sp. TH134]